MKKLIFTAGLTALMSGAALNAQVTIGDYKSPESFSVLELVSNSRGMRLPQFTTQERDTLDGTVTYTGGSASMIAAATAFIAKKTNEAMGLTIFNTDTKCVETWNGTAWIMQCDCGDHPCPGPHEEDDIPTAQPDWSAVRKWVGAFWKDDQTGERIIASKNSGTWTAEVVDSLGDGAWLTLDDNGGYDPNLWTDNPGDAENYKLPSPRKARVDGTGNILFRIGATSINPAYTDAAYKYPNGDAGKPPRYATITLTIGGSTSYTIYCRQGEAADYVFTSEDIDKYYGSTRSKARKFSPYNLTNKEITEETDAGVSTGVATDGTNYKGKFVDYPTKAGAFFQWAGKTNVGYAYHPTEPAGNVNGWVKDSPEAYWDALKATHETCPDGWRRPDDGSTSSVQASNNNIDVSEMRQSLYAEPQDGGSNLANEDVDGIPGCVWGYYADGYFDRRAIEESKGDHNTFSTAVSPTTKDAAYIGNLFFNDDNGNRSLFVPAAGLRSGSSNGALNGAGGSGYYWSSSSSSSASDYAYGWCLHIGQGGASQDTNTRYYGTSVRCVVDE
jgi:hypothetical protein